MAYYVFVVKYNKKGPFRDHKQYSNQSFITIFYDSVRVSKLSIDGCVTLSPRTYLLIFYLV